MSDKLLIWLAAVVPFVLCLILSITVLMEFLWWGWALVIIFLIGFFVRIKKRKQSWLNALNISLVVCGIVFGGVIVFLAA